MTAEDRPSNPYVGLRPFDRDDSLYFFGRRTQVAELLQRLHETRFLAVVGSSGCGKSSLIRAGLIPALLGGFLVEDRDRWLVAKMKPGGGPIGNLARALCSTEEREPTAEEITELTEAIAERHEDAVLDHLKPRLDSHGNLLLLLDQFEEIFAFRGREQEESLAEMGRSERRKLASRQREAADFVDLVLLLANQREVPIYVVLTMRSDFLGDCDLFYGLPEATNLSRYLVPRLDRGQLREAIEGPPLLMGQQLAPRLVDALLNELGDRSDRLPILQHALMRSWNFWQSKGGKGSIDLEHYQEAGTLREALPRHANEAFREADLFATAGIFKCLTDTDPHRRRVRRAASMSELAAVAGVEREVVEGILQRFNEDGRNFLLISADSDDPQVEITHESLIRQWHQLARWVDEECEARDQFGELVVRARGGRAMLQDPDLQIALQWRAIVQPTKAWAKRYSRDAGDFEAALEYLERSRLARVEAENRRRRNRNLAVAATVAVVLALSVLALWALDNAARARDTARVAMARNWMERDPTLAAMLLLEVKRPDRASYAAPTMRQLLEHPIASNVLRGHEGPVKIAVFSPDGARIATGSDDGTARVWSVEGSSPTVVLRGHEDWVEAVAFGPDGARVVTGSGDGTARVWSADGSGEPVVLRGHEDRVGSVAFSPDGTRILTGSDDGTARLWSADGSGEPTVLRAHDGPVEVVAFSPDGNWMLTASEDGTAGLWSGDGSGAPVILRGHEGSLTAGGFSPDGTRIVTGSADGGASVWSVNGSKEPVILGAGSGLRSILSAAFSPDGSRVVTTAFNQYEARVWEVDDPSEPLLLVHERGPRGLGLPVDATFSRDGSRILTGSAEGTLRVWNADGSGTPVVLNGHEGLVWTTLFSPDGTRFVTTADDGTARVWSTGEPGEPLILRGHDDWVEAAAFSPDGGRIVTASDDGTARVWSADGSGEPVVLQGHESPVRTAVFSRDGTRILTASDDGTAKLSSADGSGEPVSLDGHERAVRTAVFSPDGTRIVTASEDGTARVWSADGSGEPVVLEGHEKGLRSAAFSPDGSRIVTGSEDETARVWSADGSGEPVVLRGHEDAVTTAAFSSDGARIVTASGDWTARVWNADGSGEPEVLEGHEGWVGAAAFSSDGTRVVTASDDYTARVWNADGSGEPLVLRHDSQVGTAVFSLDGERVLTTSADGTARVWNADGSGEPLILSGHEGRLTGAAFSPDGARIVTASTDGTARVWAYTADRLQQAIASLTHGCLDARFRESYLDESPRAARRGFAQCERRHGRAR